MRIHRDHLRRDYEEHVMGGTTYFLYKEDLAKDNCTTIRAYVVLDDTMMSSNYVIEPTDVLDLGQVILPSKNLNILLGARRN